jgi:predicted nucleotidyltransferase
MLKIGNKELLAEIKKIVLQQEPQAEIVLYSSYARGDQRADSDLDILILLDKERITREDQKPITYRLNDLESETNRVISPLIRSKKIWNENYPNTALFININREGIRL